MKRDATQRNSPARFCGGTDLISSGKALCCLL
nr:MAG TPA: hypothetical protein [Caudoviricetes sp.]